METANVAIAGPKHQPSSRPRARRWDHVLSVESSSRKAAIMQQLHRSLTRPGILSLGPGAPRPEYYPFDNIDFTVPSIGHFTEDDMKETGVRLHTGKYDRRKNKDTFDLQLALNYGQADGSTQLLDFVVEHVKLFHDPPYQDWKCILSAGSGSMFDLVLRMFSERGQYILVEEYTYPTALETAVPLGLIPVGIKLDVDGIDAVHLDHVLNTWDPVARNGKKPHVLYTVPTGQNPTGVTATRKRREQVYQVAQKHDLIILEDDPYYFIQMSAASDVEGQMNGVQPHQSNGVSFSGTEQAGSAPQRPVSTEEFRKTLLPTYLNLDVDGRVVRMDSFSKIAVPGLRTGWVVASEQIIDRLLRAHEASVQNPSGFSQLVLFKLLRESWDHGGLTQWLIYLQTEYTKRRDNFMSAFTKYLPQNIVTCEPPIGGFFIWLTVDWTAYPEHGSKSTREIEMEIYDAAVRNGTLVVPGHWFQADPAEQRAVVRFRCTFASLPLDDMTEAIRRFGAAVHECFRLQE